MDLARAFKCKMCPANEGIISCRGNGLDFNQWACVQCGYHPDVSYIQAALDEEKCYMESIRLFKKTLGVTSKPLNSSPNAKITFETISDKLIKGLLESAYLHYSHYLVIRCMDIKSEEAWLSGDLTMAEQYVDLLIKAINRIITLDNHIYHTEGSYKLHLNQNITLNHPCLDIYAQYLEFMAQIHHAQGNAHTTRHYFNLALIARGNAAQHLSYWYARTKYMALYKPLANYMDGK